MPQTLATSRTPGGVAPWMPWHVAQLGAMFGFFPGTFPERICPCTPFSKSSSWEVGIRYGFIRAATAWHFPHVAGMLEWETSDFGSDLRRISCIPWQEGHTATPRA